MKIFVAHASNSDFHADLYKPLRALKLNAKHEITLPQENGHETITKEFIKSCDLVIAECSFPSTGEGIELGWANILHVPIICIYKEGITVSNALSYVSDNIISYKDSVDMIEKLTAFLEKE